MDMHKVSTINSVASFKVSLGQSFTQIKHSDITGHFWQGRDSSHYDDL